MRTLLVITAVLALAGCASGDTEQRVRDALDRAETLLDSLSAELEAARGLLDELATPTEPAPPSRWPFPPAEVECDDFCQSSDGEFITSLHYSIFDRSFSLDETERLPIYFGAGYFRIGVDQGSAIGALKIVGTRGDVDIRHGRIEDGADGEKVRSYLDQTGGRKQFPGSPEVRVVDTATAQESTWIKAAVNLVNAALPEASRMRMGAPLPAGSGSPHNAIKIEFIAPGSLGSGIAGRAFLHSQSSRIVLDRGASVLNGQDAWMGGYRRAVILIAHELVHALGIDGHVSPDFDSIMAGTGEMYHLRQGIQQPSSLLYPIDREALRALYGSTSPTDFGSWSAKSTHLHGNGPHAGFGVALRNGYAEPYAYGSWPGAGDLADNDALTGTVTWDGTLLGFSERRPVAGAARIAVELSALSGTADFTALESWPAGSRPGEAGSGSKWLDGDLGYRIAVDGKTFRETGGDAG